MGITPVEQLEASNGATPPQMNLKVIDHLDAGALRWLGASPLAIICAGEADAVCVTLAGGSPGFAGGDAAVLHLPLDSLDDPGKLSPGGRFGGLFLIPGIGETLRVNGAVVAAEAGVARVSVEEVYGHCAKALIRSELWQEAEEIATPADPAAFVAASRFLALATVNAQGQADVSPKGNPAGRMASLDGGGLWFADRPGNRRVDSFRNIVERPEVAIALLIPGCSTVAIVKGRAILTTDEVIRRRLEVQGKLPKLVTRVVGEGEAAEMSSMRNGSYFAHPDVHSREDSLHGRDAGRLQFGILQARRRS